MDYKNKKVAVIGLGVEGASSAMFLSQIGAHVTILDQKPEAELDQALLSNLKKIGIEVITGQNYLNTLLSFDLIVRSPGVLLTTPKLQEAREKGIEITSQTKLFLDLCPSQIIGITGTKGKGTTASLIFDMLKQAGKDVYLGGNIGLPPLTFLEKLTKDSWVVLELSSFQLQDLHKSPHIAVKLMVVPEHLNYHKDMAEYVDAKRNILRFQTSGDFAILNRDYIPVNESDIHTEAKVYYVSRERNTDEGCFLKEHALWVRMNGPEYKVIDIKDILLPGSSIGGHNLENVASAIMAATLAGVSRENIESTIRSFKGLQHRLELVRELNGVKYYDDSFSTTPETAIAAIQAFDSPEILILGGAGKNSDFTELGAVIGRAKNIRAIIGVGAEWERIKAVLPKGKLTLVIEGAKDMQTIVAAAAKIAQPGDVVLLSPACTSFDMFKNYKERGEQFGSIVRTL